MNGASSQPILLTESQAAQVLGVKARLLRDLRGRGRIGYVRVGRLVRYRRDDLDAFVRDNVVEAGR